MLLHRVVAEYIALHSQPESLYRNDSYTHALTYCFGSRHWITARRHSSKLAPFLKHNRQSLTSAAGSSPQPNHRESTRETQRSVLTAMVSQLLLQRAETTTESLLQIAILYNIRPWISSTRASDKNGDCCDRTEGEVAPVQPKKAARWKSGSFKVPEYWLSSFRHSLLDLRRYEKAWTLINYFKVFFLLTWHCNYYI